MPRITRNTKMPAEPERAGMMPTSEERVAGSMSDAPCVNVPTAIASPPSLGNNMSVPAASKASSSRSGLVAASRMTVPSPNAPSAIASPPPSGTSARAPAASSVASPVTLGVNVPLMIQSSVLTGSPTWQASRTAPTMMPTNSELNVSLVISAKTMATIGGMSAQNVPTNSTLPPHSTVGLRPPIIGYRNLYSQLKCALLMCGQRGARFAFDLLYCVVSCWS